MSLSVFYYYLRFFLSPLLCEQAHLHDACRHFICLMSLFQSHITNQNFTLKGLNYHHKLLTYNMVALPFLVILLIPTICSGIRNILPIKITCRYKLVSYHRKVSNIYKLHC